MRNKPHFSKALLAIDPVKWQYCLNGKGWPWLLGPIAVAGQYFIDDVVLVPVTRNPIDYVCACRRFEQLCVLMSESANWAQYRNRLDQHIASNSPFIPFLGMFLTQVSIL